MQAPKWVAWRFDHHYGWLSIGSADGKADLRRRCGDHAVICKMCEGPPGADATRRFLTRRAAGG